MRTNWLGATPYEIEQEIIEEQEDVLKSLPNLVTMESSSYNNYGEITLTFKVGTDLERTLSRVSNKLNEVGDYPQDAKRPVITGAGACNTATARVAHKRAAIASFASARAAGVSARR